MDAILNHRIRYELQALERMKKEYVSRQNSLYEYKGAFLRRAKYGEGKYYYYVKRPGEVKYRYIKRSDHRIVEKVREARFLEEAIRRIDRDIELLQALMDGYLSFDPSSVSESLPMLYRYSVPPVPELYRLAGSKWKAGRLEFQKRFPENYPQHKTQRTSDGVMVKTISEVVVYEMLKAAGLAFVYELPFPPKDHGPALYPDFTILSPVDMKTEIIVEFVGRLDLQRYREDFAKRVGRYLASGFIPGVNLFFVFGDPNGNIDTMQVTKVIEDIMGSKGPLDRQTGAGTSEAAGLSAN